MNLLRNYLEQWNLPLSSLQEERFGQYYELLIEWNRVMNLTAITELPEVEEKHFLDSLALTQALPLSGTESLIDIGTGAGFPGLPLKILFPEMKMVLADALQKRVDFLNEVIHRLQLENITAVHARAEELAHDAKYREAFDLCVSRAVAPLPILLEYCLPFVRTDGIFAAYKSLAAEDELASSGNALSVLGGTPENSRSITLGPSDLSRTILLIRKTGATPEKYPRAAGKVKKKPL